MKDTALRTPLPWCHSLNWRCSCHSFHSNTTTRMESTGGCSSGSSEAKQVTTLSNIPSNKAKTDGLQQPALRFREGEVSKLKRQRSTHHNWRLQQGIICLSRGTRDRGSACEPLSLLYCVVTKLSMLNYTDALSPLELLHFYKYGVDKISSPKDFA